MLGSVEARMEEVIQCASQAVSNALWSYLTAGRKLGEPERHPPPPQVLALASQATAEVPSVRVGWQNGGTFLCRHPSLRDSSIHRPQHLALLVLARQESAPLPLRRRLLRFDAV